MEFNEAVRTVFRDKYVTFSGRARRSEYWWSILAIFLVTIAYIILYMGAAAVFVGVGSPALIVIIGIVGFLLVIASILPMISVVVRRFHDRNISGWWYLALFILGLVPYVGFLTGIAIFIITLLPGTEGPNKFGPDPLRPDARAAVFA